jgi:hypothetical protein
MQEFMETYIKNQEDIEKFLIETIRNLGHLNLRESNNYEKIFSVFPSLELIYICDKTTLDQISPNIYRNALSYSQEGINRKYLMNKIHFNENGISVSAPYISSASGTTCVTVAKLEKDKIFFLDFKITALLQRLGLIEIHDGLNKMNKGFYFLTGLVMALLAIFTLGYSVFELIHSIFFKPGLTIEAIFKPIVAVTLGLAIFDLAKTLLEQEVFFKSYSKHSKAEYKVLTKFSITIIIALLIEALMVVFKIALEDYSQMINAVYLILGVGFLISMLSVFIYLTKKSE